MLKTWLASHKTLVVAGVLSVSGWVTHNFTLPAWAVTVFACIVAVCHVLDHDSTAERYWTAGLLKKASLTMAILFGAIVGLTFCPGCNPGMRVYDFGEVPAAGGNPASWHAHAQVPANSDVGGVSFKRTPTEFTVAASGVKMDVAPAWSGQNQGAVIFWNGMVGTINAAGQFVPMLGGPSASPTAWPTLQSVIDAINGLQASVNELARQLTAPATQPSG